MLCMFMYSEPLPKSSFRKPLILSLGFCLKAVNPETHRGSTALRAVERDGTIKTQKKNRDNFSTAQSVQKATKKSRDGREPERELMCRTLMCRAQWAWSSPESVTLSHVLLEKTAAQTPGLQIAQVLQWTHMLRCCCLSHCRAVLSSVCMPVCLCVCEYECVCVCVCVFTCV